MAKKTTTKAVSVLEDEDEYALVYKIYITTLNITVHGGGTVIMQTGKPSPPPTPPDE
jgi:hypothetical protein